MFRKDLLPLLRGEAASLSGLARAVGEKPRDVSDALRHLEKSLAHTSEVMVVDPAECRRCGFEFSPDKMSRPSKCPECRGTWIAEPFFSVRPREAE